MRSAVVRLVLLALVAAAGAAAWAAWLRGEDAPPEAQPAVRLYAVEQDAIVSVRIATGDGEAAFTRGPDGWRFASDPLLPVNPDRWGGIVLLLSGPRVDRVLPAPDDPGDFGFDAPSTVAVGLSGGREVTVRLGDLSIDGRSYYATVDGREGAALVNAPWADALARLVREPPRPYWFYQVEPSLVRVFEAETTRGAVTFLLGLSTAEGEPSARVVAGGSARDLDAGERAELMRLVGGPPGFRVLPWPRGRGLDSLGFASPEAFIRLSYELASPVDDRSVFSAVYAIGAPTPDGDGRYAATGDADALLAFDAAWTGAALTLAERYLAR